MSLPWDTLSSGVKWCLSLRLAQVHVLPRFQFCRIWCRVAKRKKKPKVHSAMKWKSLNWVFILDRRVFYKSSCNCNDYHSDINVKCFQVVVYFPPTQPFPHSHFTPCQPFSLHFMEMRDNKIIQTSFLVFHLPWGGAQNDNFYPVDVTSAPCISLFMSK